MNRTNYHRKLEKDQQKEKRNLSSERIEKEKKRCKFLSLKSKFGITVTEYEELFKYQEGKCPICKGQLLLDRFTHLDHCHKTGKVRGLLCLFCNTGLGNFKDNPVFLESAIQYLRSKNAISN